MKLFFIGGQSFTVTELVKPAAELTPSNFIGLCQHALKQGNFIWVRDQDGDLQAFNPAHLVNAEFGQVENPQ